MKTFIEKQENGNRKSVLKEYYARYLQEIRGLSDSSVKHLLMCDKEVIEV